MTFADYDAVIRTDRCGETLQSAVAALRAQTLPPRQVIFVDSSRDATCRDQLSRLGDAVVPYPDLPFNFSLAINIGVKAATADHVLLISSHVVLDDSQLIRSGCAKANAAHAGLVYWTHAVTGVHAEHLVDANNFDGHNGLSNACAMLPRPMVLQRPFREEVFSAEDQEWAGWFLRETQQRSLRIEHPRALYLNPNVNALKTINEEIAIAYFVDRRWLRPRWIVQRVLRAALAALRGRRERAHMHWEIAKGLVLANFRQPRRQSRYF